MRLLEMLSMRTIESQLHLHLKEAAKNSKIQRASEHLSSPSTELCLAKRQSLRLLMTLRLPEVSFAANSCFLPEKVEMEERYLSLFSSDR